MLEELIIHRTDRVPRPVGPTGDGAAAARQLDAALTTVGFKLSGELLTDLAGFAPETVVQTGRRVLDVVRARVGDHVRHNVYFIDFPANVPDTLRFWVECVRDALLDPRTRVDVRSQLSAGAINLLTLPRYGRYRHTYDELLAAHDEFISLAADRLTVIERGGALEDEVRSLYLTLAGSATPLSADDLAALGELAHACAVGPQPDTIPMRENRALVNCARLGAGGDLMIDTVTDVLRLACAMSAGDVTLAESTKFRSFRRPERRSLLAALDAVVASDPNKLADVSKHREPWKRLGERLHPHEHPRYARAAEVFAVSRGAVTVPSTAARVEAAFRRHDIAGVLAVQRNAPGTLVRGLDRLVRAADSGAELDLVVRALTEVVGDVSGRVLLSLREHLENRHDRTTGDPARRIFVNRAGRAWAAADDRDALDEAVIRRLTDVIDAEIAGRLPAFSHLAAHRDFLDVALPLSAKQMPPGIGSLPRGSVTRVEGELLRFFVYWHEAHRTTDFDLSALLLDERFENPDWLSYTNLTTNGGTHSGDITAAPDGASEFINLELARLKRRVVVPQVNVYSGEGFDEVTESFFGYMLREHEQRGMPFEPRTVRMKSDLRGPGRVALPVAFVRDDGNTWRAHWLHLFLRGEPAFNRVENNRVSTTELVRSVLGRTYLTVRYLIDLLKPGAVTVLEVGDPAPADAELTLGPETLDQLGGLIPE